MFYSDREERSKKFTVSLVDEEYPTLNTEEFIYW